MEFHNCIITQQKQPDSRCIRISHAIYSSWNSKVVMHVGGQVYYLIGGPGAGELNLARRWCSRWRAASISIPSI
jgi:hypothetical protein